MAVQRMKVADILAMPAPVPQVSPSMAEWITRKDVTTPKYRRIAQQMAAEGQTRKPVCVTRTVVEGCHRLAIAVELGWTEMDTTDDWRDAT